MGVNDIHVGRITQSGEFVDPQPILACHHLTCNLIHFTLESAYLNLVGFASNELHT